MHARSKGSVADVQPLLVYAISLWAATWVFQRCVICDQQSLRSACAYAQSDQSLCYSLEYFMSVKLLSEHHLEYLSLKGGCTGSYETTLVKMPHCWKSHVVAQIYLLPRIHFNTCMSYDEKENENDQEMPQSQTTTRHHEEETQNTNSHTTTRTQLKWSNQLFLPQPDDYKPPQTTGQQ